MTVCKHCDHPIVWSAEYESWLHPHSEFILCTDLEATPKEAS